MSHLSDLGLKSEAEQSGSNALEEVIRSRLQHTYHFRQFGHADKGGDSGSKSHTEVVKTHG